MTCIIGRSHFICAIGQAVGLTPGFPHGDPGPAIDRTPVRSPTTAATAEAKTEVASDSVLNLCPARMSGVDPLTLADCRPLFQALRAAPGLAVELLNRSRRRPPSIRFGPTRLLG